MKEILEKVDRLNREVVQLVGQGDFERATKIAREAVKIGRKNLSRYPIFADSLNNLAELYRMQGYFLEAKPLYIEALNLRKELLGDFHPDIAQALNNIAAFYVSQGLYSQAENYLFAALDIFKYHLDDEHEQSLDLRGNQLTVLSACDTARGDIKIGEGVFGLRRAFTTAGSKALIMSLWKVPDRATALLMERFFDNYQDGMEPIEALQNAQDYIRNIAIAQLRESALGMEILAELAKVRGLKIESCNDREKPLAHPFYWGAWICQGF